MCPGIDQLEQFLTQGLSGSDHRSVEQHLSSCADCRVRLGDLRENRAIEDPVRRLLSQGRFAEAAAPDRIGPYRVLRRLGSGGMGTVYEAEQDRPRRVVALKVLRIGFVSEQARRRFEYESQVLGHLRHPGIAQVYDAGTANTEQGPLPYFAMELIRGQTLRRFVEERRIDSRGRLQLVRSLCEAVHHAHQKGVIHRDLKPSNILVDEYGQPRILDFGVARLTASELQVTTLTTDAGQLIGTIPYMSPEQVSGSALELDTRSDVYALGVILFELLTGRLPYDLSPGSVPEAIRVIREQEPRSLSAIDRRFRGDVDTIVGRALEKDREGRYASAAQLGADIARYLDDEPIAARPPSPLYQLRKFARRHRAGVAAALVTLLALFAGTGVATWQALRATRNERLAEQREAQARAVSTFLQNMLESADPEGHGAADVTVADTLAAAVAGLDGGELSDQPDIETTVRTTIGNTYRALGKYPEAETQLRRADELGRNSAPRNGSPDLARALNKLARVLQDRGRYGEAESAFREALDMRIVHLGEHHPDVAIVRNNLGWVLDNLGRYDEAEMFYREALRVQRQHHGNRHGQVASTLNNLAILKYKTGRVDQALPLIEESLEIDYALRGEHVHVAATMMNLAVFLGRAGRHDEAVERALESRAMYARLLGEEHPSYATATNNLATIHKNAGAIDEAERLYSEALDLYGRLHGPRHPLTLNATANFANLLAARERLDAAIDLHRGVLQTRLEVFGTEHRATLESHYQLAGWLMESGEADAALDLLEEGVAIGRRIVDAADPLLGRLLQRLGECQHAVGRHDDAERFLLEAQRTLSALLGDRHALTRGAREALASYYASRGDPGEARRWQGSPAD